MDPFTDTIPDEHGEEIRKRIRERDGPELEGPPKKRARADTLALLESEGEIAELNEPPKPEDDLKKYDRERLQQGLRYVDEATKRKITPRTNEFLQIHKEAYKAALDSETPKQESCAVVRAMDRVYYSAAFYLRPRDPKEYQDLMYYVKLRRLELLANYGDYLGQNIQQIRASLKAEAVDAACEVKGAAEALGPPTTWVEIADELAGADMNDLRKQVYIACAILGLDLKHTLWLIEEWAQRNRIFHNHIREDVIHCRWGSLANQLSRDLRELLNVATDVETAENYEKVLLSIQNEYFNVYDRDDLDSWIPNEKAQTLTREKSDNERRNKDKEAAKAAKKNQPQP